MISTRVTFKEVWRIMADEPDKQEPQTPDEAIKSLRRTATQHTATMDEMASILEAHEATLALLVKQGVFLTLSIAVVFYMVKSIAKEVGNGRPAQ